METNNNNTTTTERRAPTTIELARAQYGAEMCEDDSERLFMLLVEVAATYVDELRSDSRLSTRAAVAAVMVALAENLDLEFGLD